MAQTVFVTKYALSRGVVEAEVLKADGDMVTVRWRGGVGDKAYFHGQDWQETLELAELRVKKMVEAKLRSLSKQHDKLSELLRNGAKVTRKS